MVAQKKQGRIDGDLLPQKRNQGGAKLKAASRFGTGSSAMAKEEITTGSWSYSRALVI